MTSPLHFLTGADLLDSDEAELPLEVDSDALDRPTALGALAIFGAGLFLAAALLRTVPALAALALVGGIIGGGIMNAPAGHERRQTAAALGLPALGLLVVTSVFLSSL